MYTNKVKVNLLFLLFFIQFASAQIVTIPDANFKARLIAASSSNFIAKNALGNYVAIDTNTDSEIQESEALVIEELYVNNSNIANLTGILAFSNLKILNCQGNNLTTLDVSSLINLETFTCSMNSITSLNVSNQLSLEYLNCQTNNLVNLDLSGLVNLTTLLCDFNPQLENLILDGLVNLEDLSYGGINLNPINFNDIPNLKDLSFGDYNQASIDFSGLQNLISISIGSTNLTSLDLSDLKLLNSIIIANNPFLQFINLKNGNDFQSIIIDDTNVLYVCCNDFDLVQVTQSLAVNNPTAHTNTYCTFVPGGNYNTITGETPFDENNNGCDALDSNFPLVKIDYTDGVTNYSTFTDNNGNYNLYTNNGDFTITPKLENPSFFNISPTSATISFANSMNNSQVQDFCISKNGIHPDVEVVVAPIYPSVSGNLAKYQIVFKNKGTETHSGTINFNYEHSSLSLISTSQPTSSQGIGSLAWEYTNLKPFENRSYEVIFNVTALENQLLTFTSSITQNGVDEILNDNVFTYYETVVSSFDPINITCLQGSTADASSIGDYLHYIVNYENTSNTVINNIVLKTEIDTSKFDISTLQLLNTFHNEYIRRKNNTVEFIFENAIVGGPGGHGNILLKIKTLDTLLSNDVVNFNMVIYFDYQSPVEPEDENLVFANLNSISFAKDNEVIIYPNPSSSLVSIYSKSKIESIELYDAQGRILQKSFGNYNQLDVSNYTKGTYFVKIITSNGISLEKIVKE